MGAPAHEQARRSTAGLPRPSSLPDTVWAAAMPTEGPFGRLHPASAEESSQRREPEPPAPARAPTCLAGP